MESSRRTWVLPVRPCNSYFGGDAGSCHTDVVSEAHSTRLHRLTTPRAAALSGVLFAVLFGVSIYLIHSSLPDGAQPGSQWLDAGNDKIRLASQLMPFAGICFLWFIAVVRANLGSYEDRFFATVTIGSGLLFLAMMFAAAAVGAGLAESRHYLHGGTGVGLFGQMLMLKLSKTYALRMAAVFMMSLATIWLRTGLMPRWLVVISYLSALTLIVGADASMWLTLAFPAWVLIVSALFLVRDGAFESHREPQAH